jgi:hypothetical protein
MTIYSFGVMEPVNPAEELLIGFEWFPLLATFWRPGTQFPVDTKIRPREWTGFAYQRTGGGQTGQSEPAWPNELGGVVVKDGDGGWVAIAAGANGVEAATSPVVTSDDEDLVIGSPTVVDGEGASTKVQVLISGWTRRCTLSCQITAGQQIFKGTLQVPVSSMV